MSLHAQQSAQHGTDRHCNAVFKIWGEAVQHFVSKRSETLTWHAWRETQSHKALCRGSLCPTCFQRLGDKSAFRVRALQEAHCFWIQGATVHTDLVYNGGHVDRLRGILHRLNRRCIEVAVEADAICSTRCCGKVNRRGVKAGWLTVVPQRLGSRKLRTVELNERVKIIIHSTSPLPMRHQT